MHISPEKTCHGKTRHPSKKAAAAAAAAARAEFGGRWNAYPCPFCGGFHAGHISRGDLRHQRQQRRRRQRATAA